MSSSEPYFCTVAIVGGGCSGLLVAVQLRRQGFRGRIAIIEPHEQLGAGLAYSTPFDHHLLNVPAGKMSALPDEPSHFLDWLRVERWAAARPDSFAPRKWFGEYLNEIYQQTVADEPGGIQHVRDEATEFQHTPDGAWLTLRGGGTVHAKRVVLALGNPASSSPHSSVRDGLEDRWHLSPWFEDALRVRFSGERLLILGTGLTAVDTVTALQSQEKACRIYMLSRRGILPQVHNMRVPVADPPHIENRDNLRLLFRELRAHVRTARQADLCWRTVVDSLRPISNEIWNELPLADQRRFLRHLRTYWESHRHRMAPEIRARMDQYRASGAVEIIAGRLRDVSSGRRASDIVIRLRRGGERTFEVDRVISCTGVQENYANKARPVIRSLVASGLAQANDLGIGFRTDSDGALLDRNQKPSSTFFTLGPPRRGDLFETTAVPEIRCQAKALARLFVGRFDSHQAIALKRSDID